MESESSINEVSLTTSCYIAASVYLLAFLFAKLSARWKQTALLFMLCLLVTNGAVIHAIGAWDLLKDYILLKAPSSFICPQTLILLLPAPATFCIGLVKKARCYSLPVSDLSTLSPGRSDWKEETWDNTLMKWSMPGAYPDPGGTRKRWSDSSETEDIEEIHRAFPPPRTRAECQLEDVLLLEYSVEPSNRDISFERAKTAFIVRIWKLSTRLGLVKNKVAELSSKVGILESENSHTSIQLVSMTTRVDLNKNQITQIRNMVYQILLETIPEHHTANVEPDGSDFAYIVRAVSDLGNAYNKSKESLVTPLNKRQQTRLDAERARRVEAEEKLGSFLKSKDAEDKRKRDLVASAEAKVGSAEAEAGKARDDVQLLTAELATEKDSHAGTKQLLDAEIIKNRELDLTNATREDSLKTAVNDKVEADQNLRKTEKEHKHSKGRLLVMETKYRNLSQVAEKFQKQLGRSKMEKKELEDLHNADQKELGDLKMVIKEAKAAADVKSKAHQESSKEAAKFQDLWTKTSKDVANLSRLRDTDQERMNGLTIELSASKKREKDLEKDLEAHKATEAASQEKIRELMEQLAQANAKLGTPAQITTSTPSGNPDPQHADTAADPIGASVNPSTTGTAQSAIATASETSLKDDAATQSATEEALAETDLHVPESPVVDPIPAASVPHKVENDMGSSADGKAIPISQDSVSEGGKPSTGPFKDESSMTEELQQIKETQDSGIDNQGENEPIESGQPEQATDFHDSCIDSHVYEDDVEDGEPKSDKKTQAGDLEIREGAGPVGDTESGSEENTQDDDLEVRANIEPVEDDDSKSANETQGGDQDAHEDTGLDKEGESQLVRDSQNGDLEVQDSGSIEACEPQSAKDAADGGLEVHEAAGPVGFDNPRSVKDAQDGDLEVQDTGYNAVFEPQSANDAADGGPEGHENTSPVGTGEPQQAEDVQVGGTINLEEGGRVGNGEFKNDSSVGESKNNDIFRERVDCKVPEQASQGDEEQENDALFEDCSFEGGNPFIQGDNGDIKSVPVNLGSPQQDGQCTENANPNSREPLVQISPGADDRPDDMDPENHDCLPEGNDTKPANESDVPEAQVSGNEDTQHLGGSDTSLGDDTEFDSILFDGRDLFGEPFDPDTMDGIDFSDPVPSTDPIEQTHSGNQRLDTAGTSDPTPSTNATLPTRYGDQVMDGTNMSNSTFPTNPIQQTHDRDQAMNGTNLFNPTPSTSPTQQPLDEDQVMGGTDLTHDNSSTSTNQETQNGDQIMEDVGGANRIVVPSNGFGSGSQTKKSTSPASFVPVIQGYFASLNGSGATFGQSSLQSKPVVSANYAESSGNDGSEDHIMSDENDPPMATQPLGVIEDQEMDEADELESAIESFKLPSAGRKYLGYIKSQQSNTPIVNVPNHRLGFQECYRNVTSQATNSALTPSSTCMYGNHTAAPRIGGASAYHNTASSTSTDQTADFNLFNGTIPAYPVSSSLPSLISQMPTPNSSPMLPQQNHTANRIQPIFRLNNDQVQEDPGIASRRLANRNNANGRMQSHPAVSSDSFDRPFNWRAPSPDTPEDIAEREAMAADFEAQLDAHHAAQEKEKEERLFAEMQAARILSQSPLAATAQGSAGFHTSKQPQSQRTTSGGLVESRTRALNNDSSNALRKMAARNAASSKAPVPVDLTKSNEARATISGSSRAHSSAIEPGSSRTHRSATEPKPTAETMATTPKPDNPIHGFRGSRRRDVENAEHPSSSETDQGPMNDNIAPKDDPPIDDQAKGHKRKNVAKAKARLESEVDLGPKKSKGTTQYEEHDPKLKGSVKYKEIGCAVPLAYNFSRLEVDRTIGEAQKMSQGLRDIPIALFEKAVEVARFDGLYLSENMKTNDPPLNETERLAILKSYRPEYKRDREMYWDTVSTMARDFNAADIRNLVSMARVQATTRKNAAGFKEPITELDFRMAAAKWKKDERYSKAKK